MPSIARHPVNTLACALLLGLCISLTGCALSSPAAHPSLYDFGPGPLSPADPAPPPLPEATARRLLIVAEIDASPALESNALLYRLAYADAQQLKPYALARWSMTPAQLVRQRLRDQLGRSRTLLNPGDNTGLSSAGVPTLRLELEEFSQWFERPASSVGLLRLRATVAYTSPTGAPLITQRHITLQRPAASADATGGVRALTAATDAAILEIDAWLRALAL